MRSRPSGVLGFLGPPNSLVPLLLQLLKRVQIGEHLLQEAGLGLEMLAKTLQTKGLVGLKKKGKTYETEGYLNELAGFSSELE